jgi:hypothetical protein
MSWSHYTFSAHRSLFRVNGHVRQRKCEGCQAL